MKKLAQSNIGGFLDLLRKGCGKPPVVDLGSINRMSLLAEKAKGVIFMHLGDEFPIKDTQDALAQALLDRFVIIDGDTMLYDPQRINHDQAVRFGHAYVLLHGQVVHLTNDPTEYQRVKNKRRS